MPLWQSRQMRWLSAAAILFALTTAAAFLQPPKPDPDRTFLPQELGWWKYPLEKNTSQRLPYLQGTILAIANPPATEQVWAVGTGGLLLHSVDAGRTWVQRSLPISDSLTSVFFFDSKHGWISGASGGEVLLTQDGGRTWQTARQSPTVELFPLTDLYFISLKDGFAARVSLFETHDGGFTWKDSSALGTALLTKVYFANRTHGWALGGFGRPGMNLATTVDSGKTWTIRRTPILDAVADAYFLSSRTGWILDFHDRAFLTNDGGDTWNQLASLPKGVNARRIFFMDRETGWILGNRETFVTTDRGSSWAREGSLSGDLFESIQFSGSRGWIAGTNIFRLEDGLTWKRSLSPSQSPGAMTWSNAQNAFIGSGAGYILSTRDSGRSWKIAKVSSAPLTDIEIIDGKVGWAVGLRGTLLKTTDGGKVWVTQSIDTDRDFTDIHFSDSLHGWAVSSGYELFRTQNGGIHWERIPLALHLRQVRFISTMKSGWGWSDIALSPGPSITFTNDGGQTWKAEPIPWTTEPRQGGGACQLIDSKRAFCWNDAELRFTADRGVSWPTRAYPVAPGELRGLHFLPGTQRGWAFDQASRIYATTDSGVTWTELAELPVALAGIRFVSASIGSALGADGSVFVTHDSGKTWENSRRHRIYPAPWYYLSLLLILGFTWMGLRRRQPSDERVSVADVLASDRPVDASQHDALNLDPLAQALSRFLRNESTQPPLTIAVTGEWGTGKSSLMNLLRDDLQRHGFRPVSFNAWHHQKEEHLLAALLENIRRQAIPAPWARGGLRYRLRLLWIRGRRGWFLAFLVAFGLAWYTGLFLADPTLLSTRLAEVEQIASRLAPWLSPDGKDPASAPAAATITWWLGLGAVAETLRRALRSFGIRPAQLLATASGSLKLSALEQQLGFREQFSREFGDVTRALQPRSMVILIDDLDRCRPENVSEILEAVNFLVSSGECVIAMGLDIDRVERAIGLAFRDVATEMLDRPSTPHASHIVIPGDNLGERGTGAGAPGGNPEDEELKLRRQRFARQYLEKLINIEVPVPRSNAEEFAKLFDVLNKDGWKPTPAAAFILKAADITRRWSPALLALALLGAGLCLGFAAQRPAQTRQAVAAVNPAPGPAPTPAISSLPSKLSPVEPPPPPVIQGRSRLYPAKPGRRSPAFLALPLGLMALLLIWRAIQAQEDIVRDSPQFVDALRTWTPFLFSKRNNPRSAKRFLNRVRYYAMFQKPYIPPMSPLQKLLIRLKLLRVKNMPYRAVPIPEKVLVALSAIQHCEREWLSDGNLYADLGEYLRQEGAPESLLKHLEEFRSWGSLEPYRESFDRISVGIRVT